MTVYSEQSERNQAMVLALIDAWHRADVTGIEDIVTDPYEFVHDPGSPWEGRILSLEEYKERVLEFPGVEFDVLDLIPSDEKVAVSWFMTMPGRDKISGTTIYYLNDGLISGHWQVVAR